MGSSGARRARSGGLRRGRRSARHQGRTRRAVSDVVATILILALTVTLFASIFAFVGSFPSPPPQNVNQFQASLVRTTNNTYLSGLTITHLAGPAIAGSDRIYLESAKNEPNWQFAKPGGIPVYWGLTGNVSTNAWFFGEQWTTTFSKLIHVPDNITVYVLTPTQLLYSVVLPGLVVTTPPAILASGVSPTSVAIGQDFEIWASLGGTLTGSTQKVNLGEIPGLSGNETLTLGSNGLYTYTTTSGPTTSGTYYATIYVTNSEGFVASTSVPVVVTTTVVSTSQVTVIVGMSPQPPTLPLQSTLAYFWATVTYTGTKTASLYVNFTISQVAGGRSRTLTVTNNIAGTGSTPVSMTGPSSITVYSASASNFNDWLLNSSVTISAPTRLVGVGTATGTITYGTQNLVRGDVYFTTSSSGGTGHTNSFSPTCGAACPYLYLEVWDNYTTALGGPASLTFSGTVTTNTSGTVTKSYTIASTTVDEGSDAIVNAVSAGTTTRWTVPTGTSTAAATYYVRMWLTIESGTTIIGYVFDTYKYSFT